MAINLLCGNVTNCFSCCCLRIWCARGIDRKMSPVNSIWGQTETSCSQIYWLCNSQTIFPVHFRPSNCTYSITNTKAYRLYKYKAAWTDHHLLCPLFKPNSIFIEVIVDSWSNFISLFSCPFTHEMHGNFVFHCRKQHSLSSIVKCLPFNVSRSIETIAACFVQAAIGWNGLVWIGRWNGFERDELSQMLKLTLYIECLRYFCKIVVFVNESTIKSTE